MKTLALTAFALSLTLGCSLDEKLRPLSDEVDAGTHVDKDAGTSDDGGVKRTVLQRNPYGNVAETQNLLWDGDFEWYSPFADEYGWLSGPPYSYDFQGVIVGPRCRSGIKCVEIGMFHGIVGIAVAAKDKPLYASIWVRPASGKCTGVYAVLGSFSFLGTAQDVMLHPVSPKPDGDGWCHLEATSPPRTDKAALFIKNQSADPLVVDDCVVKVAPEESMKAPFPASFDAGATAEMDTVRVELAKLRGPHDSPPNAAKRGLEAWSKRQR